MEWTKGKVTRFAAGAEAVLFEGKEKYTKVKESIRKLFISAKWGAEVEYQIEKINEDGKGFYDTVTAVKIIKEGPKTGWSKGKGVFRPPEELTAIECLKFAQKEFELNRGMGPANETLNTENISAKAKEYAKQIKIIAKEIKGD